jgi:leucyl-tRNA synthetase
LFSHSYALLLRQIEDMEYNPRDIESKWRQWWQEQQTYAVQNGGLKPKYYILDMFPYPSGAGLHVGHPLGYIASDILARYKRLRGFNVLHPMGYDSFGLPAEQYAIQTGNHPEVATVQNISRYREQLDNIGLSFDWSREVRTSDPAYYRWTQWIFQQLFNHYYDREADKALPISQLIEKFAAGGNAGIAAVCDEDTPAFTAAEWLALDEAGQQNRLLQYRLTFPEESFVNWCPALGTVLSNDEVKDGVSERGGHPVERKRMKQWSMRITAYADRLLEGLQHIDWPESIKEQQRNWIGRSQGASVRFTVEGHPGTNIEVFTTRVDTIYGVTFMVLAPEHELVAALTTAAQRTEVDAYIKWAGARSDVERMAEVKRVTGAFTGAYCINPFNDARVPIYIADYVLAGYGTGAVMAVPSGDQRDWNFAQHFNLPIIPILDAQQNIAEQADPTKEGRYINSGMIDGMTYADATRTLINWLEARQIGKGKVQYRLRNAVFSRQRYWGEPVPAYWKNGVPYLIDAAHLPLELPPVDKYLPTESGEPPLGRASGWRYRPTGSAESFEYELSTMPGWAGSSWYFYRYMDPHNTGEFCSKAALDYWKQVDFYIGGSEHAVGHLLYSRFWSHFLHDLGVTPEREYAKKLVNQGMIQGRSSLIFRAKERFYEQYLWIKVLQPFFAEEGPLVIDEPDFEEALHYDFAFETNNLVIEVTSMKLLDKIQRVRTVAAADGKRLLVLFTEELAASINEPGAIAANIREALQSRAEYIASDVQPMVEQLFVSHNLIEKYDIDNFSKLRVDISCVENDILDIDKVRGQFMFENAAFKLDARGQFTCAHEVEKMSKSKYNVVNPDDMVAQYGADCFRMYEMFLGPIEVAKPWDTKGITGVYSFLRRVWSQFMDEKTGQWLVNDDEPTKEELYHLHLCLKKVTEDIERFSMNTCVSHLMILSNELRTLKCRKRAILEPMTVLLAPFAPHLAEELWHRLGHNTSVCDAQWPVFEEAYLKKDTINYPIQINGKLRANIDLSADVTPQAAEAAALGLELVQKWLEGKAPKKVVFVPGRMINVVV